MGDGTGAGDGVGACDASASAVAVARAAGLLRPPPQLATNISKSNETAMMAAKRFTINLRKVLEVVESGQ